MTRQRPIHISDFTNGSDHASFAFMLALLNNDMFDDICTRTIVSSTEYMQGWASMWIRICRG